jgi:2Fe-2S ferredoxin
MPKIVITTRAGAIVTIEGQAGSSVMEVVRDNGIEDIQAVCGGCASCATCHVYIDSSPEGAMPPMTDQENDLLDSSSHRLPSSRLCCQIPFSAALDGLAITIAPED